MADETAGAPRRKDAERNRRRLLVAAREVFRDRGVAATLNDVAHHAGLGVGTVYRHFANKEELIDALFDDMVDDRRRVRAGGRGTSRTRGSGSPGRCSRSARSRRSTAGCGR